MKGARGWAARQGLPRWGCAARVRAHSGKASGRHGGRRQGGLPSRRAAAGARTSLEGLQDAVRRARALREGDDGVTRLLRVRVRVRVRGGARARARVRVRARARARARVWVRVRVGG